MACLSLLVVQVNPAFKKNFLELSDDGEEFSNYALLLQGVFTGLGAGRGLRLRPGSMKII